MHLHPYLTTEEAADYLRIRERKLYELVATGAVPCSKVTGKWLFPRAALDRWVEAGLNRPEGFQGEAPPPIIGGSHDPLLEWTVRRSGSGLALLAEGSQAGLDRLARNEVMMAVIHLHGTSEGEASDPSGESDANIEGVAAAPSLHDAVVIGFARREQGLVLASGNPLGIGSLAQALSGAVRFGQRQKGAGAQLLLERLAARGGLDAQLRHKPGFLFPTGQDLALAIRNGEIDCGIAARAVALAAGLAYVPLVSERLDLVMRRRVYFEAGPQALLGLMRRPEFARQAAAFGGYDVSEAGSVRLNR